MRAFQGTRNEVQMRLKTARGEGDQGCRGWIPTGSKVFLVLVSRGDEGPLNSVSTQPPLLARRVDLPPPRHQKANPNPAAWPGLAWLGLD